MLDGLPTSLPLKNYTGTLGNENSLCWTLSWPVSQLLYIQPVIQTQRERAPCHQDNQSKESPSSLAALPITG